ncbi:internal alternative NAD(P)H-ubiquinone oxidoreductase A2, mitochondrial-like [Glycine soja]|uniref:NADH:ubiquinone reductase (non-electrogenic) n=1 Tax=Glycine soja TaxID=3848 RepID=A0A0B2NSL0_GLYSO|nr:internal alternative NAD(P)H-ubiquinone oxidoreductase A2, mitochondrial-like [Glycine soja]KHN00116.1 Putative NADH dehydrogenase [Glycine soja]RZB95482.1 Internal alternative NAD(P)H-ubiquinone oxidoreductase A2, mitochondrial isoform A [Glycine soja]RZB95483.1 Internal alternative NAD(P)H-ubiquinone oxidoreductase A2, mitochondrial isoform B [Glycine soja]
MALARIARANLRRSGGALGSSAHEKDMFSVGGYTSRSNIPSHKTFESDRKISYVPRIKEQNYINFSMRGISGTPYHHFSSASTQTVIEESEYEFESDRQRYAGLQPTKPGEKPRVVVIGTGWAACRFLKGIDTRIYDVVCISPRNHMVFTPLLASTCVGTLEFRTVAEPVSRIQNSLARDPNSYFFLASCTGIDTGKHEIYCKAVNNGGLPQEPYQFKVAYDKLVIASGSEPLTFGIKGVKENAFFLREVNHAQEIRKRLLLNLMLSENPGISEEDKKRLLHCVVIGGGPTGVEFSGELSDFIMRDVQERYTHVKDYIHVTLIEANEILSSFDVSLRQYATKHLTKSGVRLMRGVVKEVHPKKIILSDGTEVPYGLLVWSTGVGASEFVKTLDLPKSQGGRIGVDDWLRVPSVEDVFALGDCAGFLEHTGRPVLPALAQVAERQGKFLVELFDEIGNQNGGKAYSAKGMPLGEPFVYKHLGSMASVGGYKALVDLRQSKDSKGLSLAGFVSWMIWRSAYLTRVLSWRNRFYVAVNWATTLVFGRDNSRIG